MSFLPGLEPDFDVKQELRFIGGMPDLHQFDLVFISCSGGKDSHAMLFFVKEIAEKQGASDRLIAMYADTGMEWHNAESHVRKICKAANVPLEVVYPVRPMLEKFAFRISQVQKNGKDFVKVAFPTSACRYCTSAQKCSPMDNFMRKYTGKLLKVTGERWAESKARSNYAEFVKVDRISTKKVANMGGGEYLTNGDKFTAGDRCLRFQQRMCFKWSKTAELSGTWLTMPDVTGWDAPDVFSVPTKS